MISQSIAHSNKKMECTFRDDANVLGSYNDLSGGLSTDILANISWLLGHERLK